MVKIPASAKWAAVQRFQEESLTVRLTEGDSARPVHSSLCLELSAALGSASREDDRALLHHPPLSPAVDPAGAFLLQGLLCRGHIPFRLKHQAE